LIDDAIEITINRGILIGENQQEYICRNVVEGNVSFNCKTQEIHWAMPA
tara:strand:+ start:347 stop:493 length:147 start_codon:yes stop_codon:yes gene_type:complete